MTSVQRDGASVSALAERTGITTSSVRYYLRQGLLCGARDRRGQWSLDPTSAARVAFIRAAQDRGFSLPEIATLLDPTQGETNRLAVAADVERRIRELHAWKNVLLTGVPASPSGRSREPEGVLSSWAARSRTS